MNDQPFSGEQQEYLKGFLAGVGARLGPPGLSSGGVAEPADTQRAAQDRQIAAGGKLVPEEDAKRKKNPLDRLPEITALARADKFPKGLDVFLTKYHGLFYVSPAQNSFMCRLRLPGGILNSFQLRGIAAIADDLGGGFADITTRANLQIREIPAAAAPEMLNRLAELGLTSRGAGADNVRNVTGSPTAGIDLHELRDTRPDARAMHFHILNDRSLYGLPRKFNIAFDGGGAVQVLEETNDIAFTAVRHAGKVFYRLGLGGITGHKDFARGTGIVVPPSQAVAVADAILRVFVAAGDRTNRARARLKYVLDDWGLDRFIAAVETELGSTLQRGDATLDEARPQQDRRGHIGVHPQKQPGLNYVGVVCPVGRLSSERLRGLADCAERGGSGTIRLTVWQNLLISDVADSDVPSVLAAVTALGLATAATPLRAGLVACTGNAGCKFAASNTKRHAAELVAWLEPRIAVTRPINIHLTGCPNSCAQHYIADIGLLGARVDRGEDTVEGYDLHVGGGTGTMAAIGRLIEPALAPEDLFPRILALLRAWQDEAPDHEFQHWTARKSDAQLLTIAVPTPAPA